MAVETAGAQWSVTDSQKFPTSSRAVTRVEMAVENPGTGETARLQLAIFRSNAATVRVFDQPAEPRRTVAEVMQTEGAIAGVNGGYFDPEYGLVGLLVSRGKTIAPLRKARLLSGVMVISADRLQLLRTGEVPAKRNWVEARQCGPFLVDRGRPVAGLNDTRKARRTFVAVDGKRGANLSRGFQRRQRRAVAPCWTATTNSDAQWAAGGVGDLNPARRVLYRISEEVMKLAVEREDVAQTLLGVKNLIQPPMALLRPGILLPALARTIKHRLAGLRPSGPVPTEDKLIADS